MFCHSGNIPLIFATLDTPVLSVATCTGFQQTDPDATPAHIDFQHVAAGRLGELELQPVAACVGPTCSDRTIHKLENDTFAVRSLDLEPQAELSTLGEGNGQGFDVMAFRKGVCGELHTPQPWHRIQAYTLVNAQVEDVQNVADDLPVNAYRPIGVGN